MIFRFIRSEKKTGKLSLTYMDEFTNLWVYEAGIGSSKRLFINGIEHPELLKLFITGTLTQKRLDKCITVCNTKRQGDHNE